MRCYRLSLLLFAAAVAFTAGATEGSFTQVGVGTTVAPYGFLEYLPVGYSTTYQKWPLIIFCHGWGEGGSSQANVGTVGANGLDYADNNGLPAMITANTYDPAAIVLCPQAWHGAFATSGLNNLLTYAKYKYFVDPDRVYITGLSAGADSVWKFPYDYPGKVAAISPIATLSTSFFQPSIIPPCWAAHNNTDGSNPRTGTDGWLNAWAGSGSNVYSGYTTGATRSRYRTSGTTWSSWTVGQSIGGDLNYTVNDSSAHGGWNELYGDSAWRAWILNQHLSTAMTTTIVDNDAGSPTVTTTGTWSVNSTGTAGYYGAGYYSANPSTTPTATYTPTLPRAGRYKIYMNFPESSARGNCSVDIYAGDGSALTETVVIDERTTCDFDRYVGSVLTGYSFDAGAHGKVVLRPNNSAGYIAMDAFKWVEQEPLETVIVDDAEQSPANIYDPKVVEYPSYTTWGNTNTTGTGWEGTGWASTAPSSSSTMTFYPKLNHTANYEVFFKYYAAAGRPTINVDIKGGDGSTISKTAIVNEGTAADSLVWKSLGIVAFNRGTACSVVVHAHPTSGYATADAVKFVETEAVEPPVDLIVENDDGIRVTTSGTWATSTFIDAGNFSGSNYLSGGPQTTAWVDYTPGIKLGDTYDVYMWYPDRSIRGSATVTVTIDGVADTPQVINETTPMAGSDQTNVSNWKLIGRYTWTNAADKVRVAAPTSGGYIAADAIRFKYFSSGG
jgi:hypothetical protein